MLEEMTSEEVAEALRQTDVMILTPSAVEQHGGHLPLGTDWYIGIETTRRVIDKLAQKGRRTVGYAFPLGISHKFLNFAGSLSLGHDTFVSVMKEICACLFHQGFKRFVLLSGNGGNGPAMQVAAEVIHLELGAKVLFVDPLPFQYAYKNEVLKDPKVEHHGAEGETSKILRVRPDLVVMEKAVYREPDAAARERTRLATGVKRAHERWADFAPKGYVGAPNLADAKTGEAMFERNSEWVASVIEKEYFAEDATS